MSGAGGSKSLEIAEELDDSHRLREATACKETVELRDPLLVLLPGPSLCEERLFVQRVHKKLRERKNLLVELRLRACHRNTNRGQEILVACFWLQKERPPHCLAPNPAELLVIRAEDHIGGFGGCEMRKEGATQGGLADASLRRTAELLPV